MVKKISSLAVIMLFLFTLTGCGQWNIFKWAHKEGTAASSDTTVLVADGEALLDKGDQASLQKAEEIFQKAVESNPRSSEANYGYARAVIAASGLGLADLISSVISSAGGSAGSLPMNNPFISFVSAQSGLGPNLLDPTKLNLTKLYAISKKAITPLKRIADNQTDAVIPADDFDVNFNLAFCLTIHSVCSILDWDGDGTPGGSTDMINVTGDFEVTVAGSTDLSTIQSTLKNYSTNKTIIGKLRQQIYTSMNEALSPVLNPNYLTPSDYNDNKGALHYLIIALGKIAPDAATELKDNISTLATDQNTGMSKLQIEVDNYYNGL